MLSICKVWYDTVKPVYKGPWQKPEHFPFMSPLYTGWNIIHTIHQMEKIKLPFIDSDLLYTGALYRQWFAIYRCPLLTVICYIQVPCRFDCIFPSVDYVLPSVDYFFPSVDYFFPSVDYFFPPVNYFFPSVDYFHPFHFARMWYSTVLFKH